MVIMLVDVSLGSMMVHIPPQCTEKNLLECQGFIVVVTVYPVVSTQYLATGHRRKNLTQQSFHLFMEKLMVQISSW